ncbi:unnamed protein product [Durusdinium trenchii]|uniref:Uncharacterized protein n=1 Tax=Durusdinium trenchii TaxID=1381693 RepID=A0ABP0HZI6_9DINO
MESLSFLDCGERDTVVTAVCAVSAVLASCSKDTQSRQLFLIFALVTGLSFGLSGASHMMIYELQEGGRRCGSTWAEDHHEWMYSWLFSLAFSPFSPAALAALSISTTEISGRIIGIIAVFSMAFSVAALQVYEFATSYVVTPVYSRSVMFINVGIAVVVPACEAKLRQSSLAAMTSAAFFLVGGLVVQTTRGLSFESFTQNAMFHCLVTVSVVAAWFASQAKSLEGVVEDRKLFQPYQHVEQDVKRARQEEMAEDEACYCCFRTRQQEPRFAPLKPQDWSDRSS